MFDTLTRWVASLGSTRSNSLSVPVFDGAFKPNNLLEEATILAERSGLEDLATNSKGQLFAACGATVFEVSPDGKMTEVASFEQTVTALAVLSDDSIAVGLGDRVVTGLGTGGEKTTQSFGDKPLVAVTALSALKDGGVLICDGSRQYGCSDWAWDLMSKNAGGRLIRLNPDTGESQIIASGLAYAFGAFEDENDTVMVSESWAHAVSRVTKGRASHVVDRLPGYPSRFSPAADGGFWLSLFCSRTQLVEFVLKENDYRQEMMKTIEPHHWISPSFGSGADFLEPLQGGGVKQMGYLKPWAPPRSYGLLVRFGADLIPQYSLHSRVGGANHGITAVAQVGDALYVLSKGAGRILKLSVSVTEATLWGRTTP